MYLNIVRTSHTTQQCKNRLITQALSTVPCKSYKYWESLTLSSIHLFRMDVLVKRTAQQNYPKVALLTRLATRPTLLGRELESFCKFAFITWLFPMDGQPSATEHFEANKICISKLVSFVFQSLLASLSQRPSEPLYSMVHYPEVSLFSYKRTRRGS
jgi:hypothetical protein